MSITLTSASFDKTSYSPGDTVTLTLGYTSTDTQANPDAGTETFAADLTLSDSSSGISPNPAASPSTIYQLVIPATEPQPVAISANDVNYPSGSSTGRTWTLVSNTLLHFDAGSGVSTWSAVLTVAL